MIQELITSEAQHFISLYENDNPSEVALKHSNRKDLPVQLLVGQIKSRQKAKSKLSEWFNTEGVIFPIGVSMEQCSSEITAKYKSQLIRGTNLIDLTGGTGVDTYYLSKQFDRTIYVEQNNDLCELARHNFKMLKTDIMVESATAETYLQSQLGSSNTFYLDPARRDDDNQKVFRISDCQPDLNQVLPKILEKDNQILIKLSPMLEIKEALKTIPNVKEVHVLSSLNECKEILFLIEKTYQGTPLIKAVNIKKNDTSIFSFNYEQESSEHLTTGPPLRFLYEPNASVLKAGAFKSIAVTFDLIKINQHSHLYTSEELIDDFPGRVFEIKEVIAVSAKALKKILINGKANLSTRNFPLSTTQLSKKLKIKDGGNQYLFATTLHDEQHRLILCEKPDVH